MPLKNRDIETLIKIEHLIGYNQKVLFTQEGERNEAEGYTPLLNPETGVSTDDFNAFWNVIEREIRKKEMLSKRANEWHKAHPEHHREYNREWARKNKLKKGAKK